MASLKSLSLGGECGGGRPTNKSRGNVVKPILKKLALGETKGSLDLDRPWEEQQWSADDGQAGAGGVKFHLLRSQSACSSFVHPKKMPRTSSTSTPSAISLGIDRAYSATIAEDHDDNADAPRPYFPRSSIKTLQKHATPYPVHAPAPIARAHATSEPRRPSLANQRTASFSDSVTRLNNSNTTDRTGSPTPSRLAQTSRAGTESPTASSSIGTLSPIRSSLEAAMPRLRSRSELDTAQRAENLRRERRKFEERERAKEARYDRDMIKKRERKDTREALSMEKEAAQRRINSAGSLKGVSLVDDTLAAERTATPPPRLSLSCGTSRKSTATFLSTSAPLGRSGLVSSFGGMTPPSASTSRNDVSSVSNGTVNMAAAVEKQPLSFLSRNYDSIVPGQDPLGPGAVEDVHFRPVRPHRPSSAKKKTLGYWHGFVLWLRMRLLRMGSR